MAEHRAATIRPLARTLDGYASIAQPRWTPWRRNQRLESTTPANYSDLLLTVITSVDTLLT